MENGTALIADKANSFNFINDNINNFNNDNKEVFN